MNLILSIVTIIITFTLLTICYKLFRKEGLYAWICMSVILANIFVCKCIDLLSIKSTLGNVLFSSVFLCTDILAENHTKEDVKKSIIMGTFFNITSIILIQLSLLFIPNELDIVNDSMNTLFSLFPRVAFSSILMFVLSHILDIKLFDKLKQITNGKYLGIRNTVATCISQCTENIIFYFMSFAGIYSIKDILIMSISCSIIEIIISICDTPFVYIMTKKFDK